jgi:bacteriocin-like protein
MFCNLKIIYLFNNQYYKNMKLSDIFRKKSTKKLSSGSITKIDKKKLAQIIGGAEVITSTQAGAGAKGTKGEATY